MKHTRFFFMENHHHILLLISICSSIHISISPMEVVVVLLNHNHQKVPIANLVSAGTIVLSSRME